MNIKQCYFSLTMEIIKKCFTPIQLSKTKKQKEDIIKYRIALADSKMVHLFCDCTDNFEQETLKKLIINYNKKL